MHEVRIKARAFLIPCSTNNTFTSWLYNYLLPWVFSPLQADQLFHPTKAFCADLWIIQCRHFCTELQKQNWPLWFTRYNRPLGFAWFWVCIFNVMKQVWFYFSFFLFWMAGKNLGAKDTPANACRISVKAVDLVSSVSGQVVYCPSLKLQCCLYYVF